MNYIVYTAKTPSNKHGNLNRRLNVYCIVGVKGILILLIMLRKYHSIDQVFLNNILNIATPEARTDFDASAAVIESYPIRNHHFMTRIVLMKRRNVPVHQYSDPCNNKVQPVAALGSVHVNMHQLRLAIYSHRDAYIMVVV